MGGQGKAGWNEGLADRDEKQKERTRGAAPTPREMIQRETPSHGMTSRHTPLEPTLAVAPKSAVSCMEFPSDQLPSGA